MRIMIRGLEFGYGVDDAVLNDIDCDFEKPEFVCIMGPNGVGKSTLIHCMNRILKPVKGTVTVDGKDVSKMKLRELSSKMGYVPAVSEDSFPLTVVDTVMIGLQNDCRFGTDKEDLARVYEVLRMFGAEDLAMRNFNELSAGQHQKIMLARGIVKDPEVVLLDEPTSNLDIKYQLEVTKTLSRLPRTNGTMVIMISHDINITAKFADRIILLSDGGIYADGTPSEVLTKESIRRVYGVDADIMDIGGKPHVILNDSVSE